MPFSSLPPELLTMICDYCDVSELKSLRATSRCLAANIPRKELFSEVLLYMTQASLGYMQNVAQDKNISQSVECLWIQGDYPKPILDFETFEAEWKRECELARYSPDVLNVLRKIAILDEERKWLGTKEHGRRAAILKRRLDDAKAAVIIEKIPKTRLRAHFKQHKILHKEAAEMQGTLHCKMLYTYYFEAVRICIRSTIP